MQNRLGANIHMHMMLLVDYTSLVRSYQALSKQYCVLLLFYAFALVDFGMIAECFVLFNNNNHMNADFIHMPRRA